MNKENAFLPHFINEEIYVIDEIDSTPKSSIKQMVKEEPAKQVAEEPKQQYVAPNVEKVATLQVELTYEGGNRKGVLLIINNISTEERAFLEKVLSAVKLTMDDCALLLLSQNSSEQHQPIMQNFDCKTIIKLGGENISFLQKLTNYKINFVDDKKVLQTDELSSIMKDVSKKKLLWECLQQLFLD